MKNILRTALVVVAGTASVAVLADAAAPAASHFYPLVGHWSGKGQLSQPGQPTAALSLDLNCTKVAAGNGVKCDMNAKNEQMQIAESDLMGVDPETNTGHWYAVTNMGEVHDHIISWPDDKTLKAHYAWTSEGKKMEENVTFTFNGKKAVEFHTIVTADGSEVAAFSGSLKK